MSERRPKKRPNVFAQVVANASETVEASFIASVPAPGAGSAATAVTPSAAPELDTPAEVEAVATPAAPVEPAAVRALSRPEPAVAPDPAPVPVPVVEPVAPAPAPVLEALVEAVRETPSSAASAPARPVHVPAPVVSAPEPAAFAVAEPASPAVEVADEPGGPAGPVTAASKAAPRRRPSAPARRSGGAHWSHQAVLESFASAAIESRNWKLHGFRVVPEILAALKARMNADRRSTGISKLAISHYLDAALRHGPTDVEEQIALAQEFLTVRMGMVEPGKQSTYRVGPQAWAWVSDLNVGLTEADYGRKGIYVVSASIESFLSEMEGAGPLQRPEMPGTR